MPSAPSWRATPPSTWWRVAAPDTMVPAPEAMMMPALIAPLLERAQLDAERAQLACDAAEHLVARGRAGYEGAGARGDDDAGADRTAARARPARCRARPAGVRRRRAPGGAWPGRIRGCRRPRR